MAKYLERRCHSSQLLVTGQSSQRVADHARHSDQVLVLRQRRFGHGGILARYPGQVQYLGGKSRIARQIVRVIDALVDDWGAVWELGCGGLSMTVAFERAGFAPITCVDQDPALITLYQSLQRGWVPPDIGPEEYERLRQANDPADPRTAFAKYALSFGAKPWEGYAVAVPPRGPFYYCEAGRRSLRRKFRRLAGVSFVRGDMLEVAIPEGVLVYADPPYVGTAGYGVDFDHDRFWTRMQELARTRHVYVSEYTAPDGVGDVVWESAVYGSLGPADRGNGRRPVERLYRVRPR